MTDQHPLQPWDREEEETGLAFSAFLLFLHLPKPSRSVAAAYFSSQNTKTATTSRLLQGVLKSLPQAPNSWKQWASTHNWEKRARAWDRAQSDTHVAQVKQKAIAQGISFRAEQQHHYLDHHGILQKVRENVLANVSEGHLSDRREKRTTYSKEEGWTTVETRTLMRDQVRILETLAAKHFPDKGIQPCDEDGTPLFENNDAIAQPGEPTHLPARPYDKKLVYANLPIPQHIRDHNDPAKNPVPGDGTPAFPPVTVDTPSPKYPYHPSHGPQPSTRKNEEEPATGATHEGHPPR